MSKGFTTFYNEVMYNKSLSTTDKAVFCAFSTFCFNSDKCFPSQRKVAEMLNICVRTVQRSLKRLVSEGYITIERKLGSVNIYTLLKPVIDKTVTTVKTAMNKVKNTYNIKKNKFHSYEQRDYNMEELEKKLLGWT
ncbi:helix-turn-helix domain-containing protein [Clostridium sp. UBA7791]|uniref:helix-turn-helix domain-containing protein n=1 Tax=Clostridium sp. UBA7791 TaxID=1946379 RepID=UPI003216D459